MERKNVFPTLLCAITLTLGMASVITNINEEVVSAAEATVEVKELLNEYYNDGSYKRSTIINLNNDAQVELLECFHAKCSILDRETYFIGDELWMSHGKNGDGKFSYYGTDGVNMTSGSATTALVKPEKVYTAIYNHTMESYYTTMHDIKDNVATDWAKNGNVYSTSNTTVIKQFLDFTAPCFLGVEGTSFSNYWTMSSVEVEETEKGLELRLVTSGDEGKLTNSNGYLSEAIINKCDASGTTTANLIVNYRLPDGTLIDTYTQDVKDGEAYSVTSPKVRFMAPSIEKVEGTMDADGELIDVTYDYSASALETSVAHGQDMGKLYVDETKGLSLSYVMKGSTGDWEQVFNGNSYAIYNGCIRVREAFPAMEYAGDWYDGENAVNGAPWNALLSSDTEEILVTWSINPDGSVAVYKNGAKVFYFASDAHSNGQWTPDKVDPNLTVSKFKENMLLEVANVGLKIGAFVDNGSTPVTWTMRDLSVNYAMDDQAAANYASQYKSIKGVYVDVATNTPIRNPYTSITKIGSEYSIPAYDVSGYSAISSTVTGIATATTEEAKITYTRNGQERLTESITRDRRNDGGWNDPSYWVNIATLTEGSVVTAEYVVNANINNVDPWRCPIVVVYDTNNTNVRATHRFDWYGWEDGDIAASISQGQMWCGSMEEYYAVAADCTVRVTYQFINNNLIETYTITANSGAYQGNVYFWNPSVTGIFTDSVTVALAPEYTQVILTSVMY